MVVDSTGAAGVVMRLRYGRRHALPSTKSMTQHPRTCVESFCESYTHVSILGEGGESRDYRSADQRVWPTDDAVNVADLDRILPPNNGESGQLVVNGECPQQN
jgi:hypothetical protein